MSIRKRIRDTLRRHWGRIRIRSIVKRGDVVIDGGANVGDVTSIFASCGATVYAFEPNPAAYNRLHKRFEDNPRVHSYQSGLHTQDGTMRLYLHVQHDEDPVKWSVGSSFMGEKSNLDKEKYFDVPVVSISDFVKNLNKRVRVLKLDVEGLEYKLLEELVKSGALSNIDHVFVEGHEDKIPEIRGDAVRIKKLLREKGYTNVDFAWE